MAICLVVDDEALHREIDRFAVSQIGFDTCEAADGEIALSICSQSMPDLILLDMMMPHMNGIDFLLSLRAMKDGQKPFILACTAHSGAGIEEKLLSAGANTLLIKPFSCAMLKEKLIESGVTF